MDLDYLMPYSRERIRHDLSDWNWARGALDRRSMRQAIRNFYRQMRKYGYAPAEARIATQCAFVLFTGR